MVTSTVPVFPHVCWEALMSETPPGPPVSSMAMAASVSLGAFRKDEYYGDQLTGARLPGPVRPSAGNSFAINTPREPH